jgi:hypothetical protein
MTVSEHASARFPGIEDKVLDRLILDESLYDGKNHVLRNGISKAEARAILLLAAKAAYECGGLKLVLSCEEDELMRRKFVGNGSK